MTDLGAPEMLLQMIRGMRAKKTGGQRCDLPLLLLLGLLIGDFSPSMGEFGSFSSCARLKPARTPAYEPRHLRECVITDGGEMS